MSYYHKQNNQINFSAGIILFIFISIVVGMTACTKMNDTYHDFWDSGEKIYPAAPDSLTVYPGKNRILLTWLMQGDPTVTKASIFWNNGKDSLEIPIDRKGKSIVDTIRVMLKDMPEGSYAFTLYAYDDSGNRSVPAHAVGRVYGDSYIQSLLSRIVNNASFINDTLNIIWGDPADRTSIGSEIIYTDTSGNSQHHHVVSGEDTTVIADFDINASHYFTYRTLFLPDSLAIDTFATKYDSVRVLGPRTLLPKTGWTATASSYDERHGDGRKPFRAIDNDEGSAWVNQISTQTYYPHSITVDMGSVVDNIFGLSFYLHSRKESPKVVDIYISNDGINWQLMGLFTLQNKAGRQLIDFAQPESFRYFKVKAEQPAGNTDNIVIYEVGVFIR